MKKLLYLFFTLLSFTALAQVGSQSVSGIKYRVNDTTAYQAAAATAHAQGYSDIYWNNQATTPHWDIWNGSSYDHVFDFNAGSGAGLVDGDYGDITVGGTGTTMTIDNGAVTGGKIANDIALGGNPTTTTQSAGNNSTRIATTAWVQNELTNNLNERVIGQVLAPSIYGSGSSIPQTTVVGGLTLTLGTEVFTIQAGGNVTTHNNYVQFNAVTTSLSKYKVYTQATTGTADANSRGLFFGVVPTQTGNGNKLVAWFDCSSNATGGKAMLYHNDVLVATSSTGTSNGVSNGGTMTNYASSALIYELIRDKDTYTFKVHNSANETVTVSYQFDLATGTVIKPGGSKFIIGSMSTQARNVYNFRVESDEIVYPDFLYVGDSHTNGYYAGSEANSFPRLMEATGRSVVVSASNGALTADIALWAADFPLVKPRKVILLAGTNDAIASVATFTFGVRHWNLYNALRATGADVWVLNLPPVATTDVTAYNAKLGQIYGQTGRLIDIFTPLSNGGTGWNATYGSDSHMNTAGQALVHSLIMSALGL